MTERRSEAPNESGLLVERTDDICILTLNRPEARNGLNYELASALVSAFDTASSDRNVRCVCITGSGTAFCSGDDIATIGGYLDGDRLDSAADPVSGDAYYLRLCEAMLAAPKPVIAGINGACVGAGTEIACAADYRIASESARIGSGLIHVGHAGNAVMLSRVVGAARATSIYLSGTLHTAAEALSVGLVDRVVPDDGFLAELQSTCRRLAKGPTSAIAQFKQIRERSSGCSTAAGLRFQNMVHLRSVDSPDAREGPLAYLGRREPDFRGT